MFFKKSISPRGLRFRLAFIYSTLFGLFICIFAFVLLRQNIQAGRNVFDSALLNYAIDVSGYIERRLPPLAGELELPKRELEKEFPITLQKTLHWIRSIEGELITRGLNDGMTFDVPYSPSLAQKPDYTHRFLSFRQAGEDYRAVNMKITNLAGRALILQVATPMDQLRAEETQIIISTMILIPLLIGLASLFSYILAGRALGPIRDLIGTTNSIAARNLSQRVPEPDTGDEIAELTKTFNTFLERLEKSFRAQENFVANASHQLNTPLAIIKGELDVLESKTRELADHERFHQSLREELERLTSLVEKMLLISRVEAGTESFSLHPVRIDELLLSTASRLGPRAREKKITVRFNMKDILNESTMLVQGERQLLEALFENLLDNAIKYSPPETAVSITIGEEAAELWVEISDEGPGLAVDDLQKYLSRFQRGSKIPGTGIGLSISYQIAEYLGARISYEGKRLKGSQFRVSFPRLA